MHKYALYLVKVYPANQSSKFSHQIYCWCMRSRVSNLTPPQFFWTVTSHCWKMNSFHDVVKFWLGFGKRTTCVGWGKDHGLGYNKYFLTLKCKYKLFFGHLLKTTDMHFSQQDSLFSALSWAAGTHSGNQTCSHGNVKYIKPLNYPQSGSKSPTEGA